MNLTRKAWLMLVVLVVAVASVALAAGYLLLSNVLHHRGQSAGSTNAGITLWDVSGQWTNDSGTAQTWTYQVGAWKTWSFDGYINPDFNATSFVLHYQTSNVSQSPSTLNVILSCGGPHMNPIACGPAYYRGSGDWELNATLTGDYPSIRNFVFTVTIEPIVPGLSFDEEVFASA